MPLNQRGNQDRNVNLKQNNMNTNKGQVVGLGQRIRLRRNVSKQQVIQQNLSHMQQSAQKKKVAQELYYSNQGSRSPLLRTNTVNSKASVHNRLGHNSPPNNTNRKMVVRNQPGNRIKLRRQILQPDQIIRNNIVRRKNEKVKRLNSVQNRILRIRQGHQNQNRQGHQNQNRPGHQNQNRQGNQNNTQKVHLRRMRPTPVNYRVQVVNSANKNKASFKHSVNDALNTKLQEEIRLIQNKTMMHDEIPSIPIHPQGTGFTGTTLNERFSQL